MEHLVLHPTATAQWHALVNEAENKAQRQLEEEVQSYLVFLLMRFSQKPQFVSSVIALDYLEGLQTQGRYQVDKLREVGDQCLLYSGLFPQRAESKQVKISYFVDVGRSAYNHIASAIRHKTANLYSNLCSEFVNLMDVLHAMREMDEGNEELSPLHSLQLWQDTGSEYSLKRLRKTTLVPLSRSLRKQ